MQHWSQSPEPGSPPRCVGRRAWERWGKQQGVFHFTHSPSRVQMENRVISGTRHRHVKAQYFKIHLHFGKLERSSSFSLAKHSFFSQTHLLFNMQAPKADWMHPFSILPLYQLLWKLCIEKAKQLPILLTITPILFSVIHLQPCLKTCAIINSIYFFLVDLANLPKPNARHTYIL